MLLPSFTSPSVTAGSNISYNRSRADSTGIWTDTYSFGMNLNSKFLNNTLFFDAFTSYNIISASGDSADSRGLSADFRLAYAIRGLLKDFVRPAIAIRGAYVNTHDLVNSALDKDELSLFLVLSTATPFTI